MNENAKTTTSPTLATGMDPSSPQHAFKVFDHDLSCKTEPPSAAAAKRRKEHHTEESTDVTGTAFEIDFDSYLGANDEDDEDSEYEWYNDYGVPECVFDSCHAPGALYKCMECGKVWDGFAQCCGEAVRITPS